MLHDIFYYILNMSITSAMIISAVIIIRALFGRWIPKAYIYPLWIIALFRMLVPVSIPSSLSLMNLVGGFLYKTVSIPKISNAVPNMTILNSIQEASSYFPLQYKSGTVETIFGVSGIVWAFGAVLFASAAVVIYTLSLSRLKTAVLVKDDSILKLCRAKLNIKRNVKVYESAFLSSPIVIGVLRPRIVIPKNIPKETLEYALLHEACHIKRFDNLWRLIFIFAACIHWFNPFAWLLLHMSAQDMEYSCDEKVLKSMEGDRRKNYANALALMASRQRISLTSFGSTAVRMRIIKIAGYKRLPLMLAALMAALCILLVVLLITNPVI